MDLEKFFSAVYHPNRVVELMHGLNVLYRFGMTGYTDRIEQIVIGEQGLEAEVIAGNAEQMMVKGILEAYAKFGVEIEFEPGALTCTIDLLEFLIMWDTPDGVSPSFYPEGMDVHELGRSNEDILIELFEMAGKNHDGHLIDWILDVSDSLIARLNDTFQKGPVLLSEEPNAATCALSDFRVFAALYPDAKVVRYVTDGGALGQSMNTLILNNDSWFQGATHDQMAIEVAGMALISDLDRDTMIQETAKLVEPVLGSTLAGQRIMGQLNKILTKVLGHGNA